MDIKNQCMGCQAGWPVEKSKYGLKHLVIGGYPYEGVGCTSDLYGYPRCTECSHFESEHSEYEGETMCAYGKYEKDGAYCYPCNCGERIGR